LGLEEAEGAGIVMLRTERIEFAHPLLASSAYLEAPARERRDVHGRLASVSADVEERARHLALSSVAPDEDVAEALEEAALQAQAKGAPSAAADLNSMAAALTPPSATEREKTSRFRAMGNLFAAGDVVAARQIAERTMDRLDAGPERALVLYATASMAWNNVAKVKELLTQALSEAGDDRLRAEIQGDLAWAALWSCDPASAIAWAESAIDLAERGAGVESIGNPLTRNHHLGVPVIVRAVSRALLGHDAMNAPVDAAEVEGEGDLNYADSTTPRACLGWLQMWAGELDAARQLAQPGARSVRGAGS
jgi:tetratricopeptide (TPR) repeat protein